MLTVFCVQSLYGKHSVCSCSIMGHKVREAKEWVARREYGWEVTLSGGEDEERLGRRRERTQILGAGAALETFNTW